MGTIGLLSQEMTSIGNGGIRAQCDILRFITRSFWFRRLLRVGQLSSLSMFMAIRNVRTSLCTESQTNCKRKRKCSRSFSARNSPPFHTTTVVSSLKKERRTRQELSSKANSESTTLTLLSPVSVELRMGSTLAAILHLLSLRWQGSSFALLSSSTQGKWQEESRRQKCSN